MSAHTEILDALSRAFMTGYDLGQSHGMTLGVWIGLAAAALGNALARLCWMLWTWHKGKPARARLAAARAEFAEFDRGLPKPTRPAPPMPECKPPKESRK